MKTKRVRSFYTRNAKWYQRFFVRFLQWESIVEEFFEENDYLRPGMSVLDAGCGTGSITKALYRIARRRGYREVTFHGFDLTPAMLDLFQEWIEQENAGNIRLQQADVLELKNQLPAGWDDYDLIVSSTMLEYVPAEKHSTALRNLKELLHREGRLLLFLTRRTGAARWIGQKLWGTNLFDRDEIAAELHRAGFSGVEFKPLPGRWDSFMLCVEARAAN